MRKYSIKKQFYVNQKEDDLLKVKSKKAGLTESEFLRSCIKGYKIKEQPTHEIREFIKQITGIANNINQIAVKCNSLGFAEKERLFKKVDELDKLQFELETEFLSPKVDERWR